VAAGATTVEPLAAVEVNPPGLMLILAAPVVFQLSVLFELGATVDGFAMNELMDSVLPDVTVTVTVLVAEPALFEAVSV
jgi:hypothetical protein